MVRVYVARSVDDGRPHDHRVEAVRVIVTMTSTSDKVDGVRES